MPSLRKSQRDCRSATFWSLVLSRFGVWVRGGERDDFITWSPTLTKMTALASVGRTWGGGDFVANGNEGRSGATYGRCEIGAAAVFSIRRARRRHRGSGRNLMRSGEGFCVGEKLIEGRAVEKFAAQDDGVNFAGVANVVERVSV